MINTVGKRLMTTTKEEFVGSIYESCLETPTAFVIGTVCDLLDEHVEALWWYRKYHAEDRIMLFTGLPPELSQFLTPPHSSFQFVLKESKTASLEFISSKSYDDAIKSQLAAKHTPEKKSKDHSTTATAGMPIGNQEKRNQSPPKSAASANTEILPWNRATTAPNKNEKQPSLNLRDSTVAHRRIHEAIASPSKRNSIVPIPINVPTSTTTSPKNSTNNNPTNSNHPVVTITRMSTAQFLEKSKRNLADSVAMPLLAPQEQTRSGPPQNDVLDEYTSAPEAILKKETSSASSPAVQDPATEPSVAVAEPKEPVEDPKTRLKRRLELYGLMEHKVVPGDGNCQFSSLSDQLYQDFDHSRQIRAQCVAWLKQNADFKLENGASIKEFCNTEEGWDHYLLLMSTPGTWGDHLTLVAAAELFQVHIFIVSSVSDEANAVIEIYPITQQRTNTPASSESKASAQSSNQGPPTEKTQHLIVPTIFLCHYAEFHYGTVQVQG